MLLRFVGYILVGSLILLFMYHYLCVYFIILVMYILVVFISFLSFYIFVFLFIYTHIALVLLIANCEKFTNDWMKTFGRVYACVFHHMQLNVYSEICLHGKNHHISYY